MKSQAAKNRVASLSKARRKPRPAHSSPRPSRGFAVDRTVGEETWLTPKWLIDALDMPNIADVDPCSPMTRPWDTARQHFNKRQDGFNRIWDSAQFYWVNPPYGAECRKWMAKLAAQGNGLLLVFARTETRMFSESVWTHPNTTAVCFIEGRLKFATVDGCEVGTAGAPSILVGYGKKAARVLTRAVRSGRLPGTVLVFGP